jgi:hypothetical protein
MIHKVVATPNTGWKSLIACETLSKREGCFWYELAALEVYTNKWAVESHPTYGSLWNPQSCLRSLIQNDTKTQKQWFTQSQTPRWLSELANNNTFILSFYHISDSNRDEKIPHFMLWCLITCLDRSHLALWLRRGGISTTGTSFRKIWRLRHLAKEIFIGLFFGHGGRSVFHGVASALVLQTSCPRDGSQIPSPQEARRCLTEGVVVDSTQILSVSIRHDSVALTQRGKWYRRIKEDST